MNELANLENLIGIEYFLTPEICATKFTMDKINTPQANNNKIVVITQSITIDTVNFIPASQFI